MNEENLPVDRNNKIIIDWLSLTCYGDPQGLISFLGLDGLHFERVAGAKGFSDRLYFDGISVHFGYKGKPDFLWLEMSGQGCRVFETFGLGDFSILFQWILSNKETVHITRLDVAYDDIEENLLNIDRICDDTRQGFYVFRGQWWEVITSSQGSSVMFGSPQSEIRLRIYDKAAERKCDPGVHWVRVELQLRRDRAFAFIERLQPADGIGTVFCGVVHNYLWFANHTQDTNKSRWIMAMYWAAFLAGASKISLWTNPGVEYNLVRCKKYVFDMAGNAVDALIKILGYDQFLDELGKRHIRQNPKYERLIFENGGCVEL